ncbi:MAG TPA: outer membrane lipoprotein-sorting protein [Firmicutes bacterium]|jgi:outer membrane lipoprotein-sorting protein|nr:outer membrane lipoprotein-sorting protein [Bacillota bacterium]
MGKKWERVCPGHPLFEKKKGGLVMKVRLRIRIMVGVVVSSLLCLSLKALAQDPKGILEEIYARQGLGAGSFILNLRVDSFDGETQQTAEVRVYLHATKKQMVTFISPERLIDQSFLVIGSNTWMYQKGLNRPLRISAQQKLFGEAGIAETVGIDYLHDYRVVAMEETATHYQLALEALERKTAYQRAKLWIEKNGVVVEKILLLSVHGEPLKELRYDHYRSLNGHEVATIEIRNQLYEKDRRTVLNYLSIQKRELPETAFDPLMMGKFQLLVKE